MTERRAITAPVFILFGSALLVLIGLLSLRSVAPQEFTTQFYFTLLTFLIAWGISRLDYQLYTFSPWPWYGLALALLSATWLLGDPIRGATRWLNFFGLSLQTSELVKPLMILFLATYLTAYYPTDLKKLIRFLLLLLVPIILVFLQPDLGTALILVCFSLAGIIAAGINFKMLLTVAAFCLLFLPLVFLALKPYQLERLASFFQPSLDPQGQGYNALQAQIAVGSGQILGRGLGQGTQSHLRFLPERHTDFVFASIVEELGFLGGLLILIAASCLLIGLSQAAKQAATETGSIICLTTLAAILFQFFINIGMNMSLLPITGVTLPLVSAGGSSTLSLGLLIGICLSVALRPQSSHSVLEIR